MNLPFDGYLRHKDAYEAADASIVLWRKNFAYFIIFFAIPFWFFAFAFRMFPGKLQYLSWVLMWYLKPFFDRLILHVISIKFFEPNANIKRLFKGLGHSLWSGLFGDLLWRRFTPFRSATMPIRILEPKKKNKKYKERKKLLDKGGLGFCFLLTFWGLALETALLLGELFFIIMMMESMGLYYDYFSTEFIVSAEIYFFALWCLNYIIVETIYVCMGFGVYINSRIEVEGWDIEIMFKGFAEKLKKKKMIGILSVLCFLFVFAPAPASAEDVSKEAVPIEKLEEIFASPDFGYEKDIWHIKEKNRKEPEEKITIINYNRNKFLKWLTHIFASGLRTVIVIAIVIAAIIIYFFAYRYFKKKNSVIKKKPVITITHDIPQDNPQELIDKSIEFFNQGDIRNAWGHCAAAAILSLKLYRNLNFAPNATETDCAKIANAKLEKPDEAQKFNSLIKTWVSFAYAGILPPDSSFEEAVTYCKLLSAEDNEVLNG